MTAVGVSAAPLRVLSGKIVSVSLFVVLDGGFESHPQSRFWYLLGVPFKISGEASPVIFKGKQVSFLRYHKITSSALEIFQSECFPSPCYCKISEMIFVVTTLYPYFFISK